MYEINPYMRGYNPYAMMPQAPQSNALPAQQILQANGKASVDAIRMAPNSSVLVMDTTAPLVWLCTSDGLGNVAKTPYDISPHKDAPPVDTGSLEARLKAVEDAVRKMQRKETVDESDDGHVSER